MQRKSLSKLENLIVERASSKFYKNKLNRNNLSSIVNNFKS